jgi:hypothetical protein
MTREEAKELWPTVKGFSEGMQVQYWGPITKTWITASEREAGFNPSVRWSIKPEPRVIWVNEYSGGKWGAVRDSREEAIKNSDEGVIGLRKFVEATE